MDNQNIKQSLADIRLFIGYSEIGNEHISDANRQLLADATARLLAERPVHLLEALTMMHRVGLKPIKPTVQYVNHNIDRSELPPHRPSPPRV